jgi:hypothetical protein
MADAFKQYFVRGPKPDETNETMKRYIAMLDDDVVKGSFFFSALFMQPKYSTRVNPPHYHPYSEVLFFQGLNPDKPEELGWEIDLYMGEEFERHIITKTSLVYIPPRLVHCPIISRMKKPVFHIYSVTGPVDVLTGFDGKVKQEGVFERHYDRNFLSGPKAGESRKEYKNCTTYLDEDVIKGSFHFTSSFVSNDNPLQQQDAKSHAYGTVLGFFGIDPDNQFELGAEVELLMGDKLEKHTFNKSVAVFIPAEMKYCISKTKVNRPFVFVERSSGPKLV